jgi:adenylyltransferase/sulfurtransferase
MTPIADALPALSREEIYRYSRHLILPELAMDGQRRLKAGRVLLVGTGGLGSPAALYLAAAGVGTLGLVDHDTVDETNLQRQILHGTAAVGRSKLDSACDRIRDLNPHVDLVRHDARLSSANALDIIAQYDLVLDGTDNFPTRYLINDACVLLGKPDVFGSIFRFEGQLTVFRPGDGPCYRCLFPEPPPPELVPSCAEGGVIGVLPGIVGTLQALEAIKLLTGIGRPSTGRLLVFDALRLQFREMQIRRDPACPACGDAPRIRELVDYDDLERRLPPVTCGVYPAQPASDGVPELGPSELKARLDRGDAISILDVREPHEWEIVNLQALGARPIPLTSLAERLHEVPLDGDVVVVCKVGARSAQAAAQLREAGFERVWNLRGGILAWAEEVDPLLPRY